jgi:hypothetical protein
MTDRPKCGHSVQGNDYSPDVPCQHVATTFYLPINGNTLRPYLRCDVHIQFEFSVPWVRERVERGLFVESTLEEFIVWEVMAS